MSWWRKLQQRIFGKGHQSVMAPTDPQAQKQVGQLNQKVVKLYQQGQYAQALDLARQSLELARANVGEEHPDTAMSLNNLAYLYQAVGNYEAAQPLFARALAICEKVLGPEHPDTAGA